MKEQIQSILDEAVAKIVAAVQPKPITLGDIISAFQSADHAERQAFINGIVAAISPQVMSVAKSAVDDNLGRVEPNLLSADDLVSAFENIGLDERESIRKALDIEGAVKDVLESDLADSRELKDAVATIIKDSVSVSIEVDA
jgi:hypothetical protein